MNTLKLALVAAIVLVSIPRQAVPADLDTAMTVNVYHTFERSDDDWYEMLSLAAAVYTGHSNWVQIVKKGKGDEGNKWQISFTYNDIAAIRATESNYGNGTAYKIRLRARLKHHYKGGPKNLELKCNSCLHVTASSDGTVKWENPQGSHENQFERINAAPYALFRFQKNELAFKGFSESHRKSLD